MNAPDGGAAFPSDPAFYADQTGRGMSLRDYFAAAALTGMLQARAILNGPDSLGLQEDVAEESYHLADAMLAQRDGRPPQDAEHVSIKVDDAVALCFLIERALREDPQNASAEDVAEASAIRTRLRAALEG